MRIRHGTLVIDTATAIALTTNRNTVSVRHKGASTTAPIYARADGVAATVGGNDTYSVMPGETREIPRPAGTSAVSLSLISHEAVPYEAMLP